MAKLLPHGERRAFGRRKIFIHAYLIVAGRPVTPCIVRNYSAKGALLEMSERIEPPFQVKLRLTSPDEEIDCEVRHIRGHRIGVQFVGPDVGQVIERALDGVAYRGRRRRPGAFPGVGDGRVPLPRVTGRDLRRRVLGQE